MFDYDWFFGNNFEEQKHAARWRVTHRKFPEIDAASAMDDPTFRQYYDSLECRMLIYLRDGFSYELRDLVTEVTTRSNLVFECEPVDELYKVGSFVTTVPFEEIARVEVFAVHPDQKPENTPLIKGFHHRLHEDGKQDSRDTYS